MVLKLTAVLVPIKASVTAKIAKLTKQQKNLGLSIAVLLMSPLITPLILAAAIATYKNKDSREIYFSANITVISIISKFGLTLRTTTGENY